MELENRVIWITGASSGIGEALALQAYKKGAKVILSARNEKKLKDMTAFFDKERFRILPLDLSDHHALPEKAKKAKSFWNQLDILVNNGGISQRSLLTETDYKVMKKIIDVNFLGTAILSRECSVKMMEQKEGYILMVSSVAGKFSTPLRTIYAASKMALQGLCDGLRAELWSSNIKVSLIVPGFVKTNISINALEGKGNNHGKMDPNQNVGISSAKAAQIIIKGIKKEKREIYMGLVPKTRFALFLARFYPGILARILRKAEVT